MVNFRETGPRISDADIAGLESLVGVPLPDAYKGYLLEFNGGRPNPDIVEIEGLPGRETDVQVFFGIRDPIKSCTIEWNIKTLAERLQQLSPLVMNLLPIGSDSVGNVFFLSLGDPHKGAVFLADLQSVFGDYEAVPQLYFVAPSFSDMLDKLKRVGED